MAIFEVFNKGEEWPCQLIEADQIKVCPPHHAPLCVFYKYVGNGKQMEVCHTLTLKPGQHISPS